MTRFIALCSAKGGVGKTTSTINIGSALNFFKKETIIVDGNITSPNIGIHLGAAVVPVNLHHVLAGQNHIFEAIYEHPSKLKIIPSSLSIDSLEKIKPEKLVNVLNDLSGVAEMVLIDSPPGLGNETLAILNAVDEVILVTTPELPSVTDTLKTARIAERLGKTITGIVLTRVNNDNLEMGIRNVESMLDHPVIGVIPEDKVIRKSLIMSDSIVNSYPNSKAAMAYKKLAASLIGRNYEEETKKEETSLFYRILSSLKLV